MNASSFRALEFEAVRSLLLSYAGSTPGRARLQALAPATQPGPVREALQTTVEAALLLGAVGRQPYHDLPEVDEALAAARVRGSHLDPLQLNDVASFIEGAGEIARLVTGCASAPRLALMASRVADAHDVPQAIRRAILPTGEVADTASPKLAEARRAIVRQRARLQSVMESFVKGKDADRLLQDKLVTTRNDRYVLLLKAEQRGQLPGIIHGSSGSGQSFFVEPLPAVELNNDIVALVEEERAEVVRILRDLTARVGDRAPELQEARRILGDLDALQAMALLAKDMQARAPEISEELRLELLDARHPLLMSSLSERIGIKRRSTKEAVPVTLRLGAGQPVLVISGPNTGGKTVALKTVGLLALMAQSGLLIPAGEGSSLPVFARIFADIGDDQSIAENLSTFSAHLAAIAEMAKNFEKPALVLLDEVGAGTDPTEGGALGVAIVDGFRRRGAMVVATTHHGLMKSYAQSTPGVSCASFGYDPETYEPTYRLSDAPGRSLAFEMAERLGLPADMVSDGRARRERKQAQAEELLKILETKQGQVARDEARVAEMLREAAEAKARAEAAEAAIAGRKKAEVEAFSKDLRRRAEEASRKAADAIQRALEKIETARKSTANAAAKARTEAIAEIRDAHDEVLREAAAETGNDVTSAPSAPLAKGARVRVATLGVVGEVVEMFGERELEVAVGGKRLRLPRTAIDAVLPNAPQRGGVVTARKSSGVPAEINLVGLTVDEALPQVDKLLDDAALSDRREIRVIHGFGQGKLRRAIATLLEGHPHVATFRPGGASEGGGGATIVELKD